LVRVFTPRTHPTRRPREDIFLPKQNALISFDGGFSSFSAAASGNRRNRGAYFCGPTVVFVLLAIMAIATIVSVLCIPASAINYEVASGLEGVHREDREHPSGWRVLLTCRPLLIFAIASSCCIRLTRRCRRLSARSLRLPIATRAPR